MIIKTYSTICSYAAFDPNKLYDRLKDKYKNIKYYNPFNENYDGVSLEHGFNTFDGVKVESLASGYVIKGIDKSKESIHLTLNAEVYHNKLILLESIYKTDKWYNEFEKNYISKTTIRSDDSNEEQSISSISLQFAFYDVMKLLKLAVGSDQLETWEKGYSKKFKDLMKEEFGLLLQPVGSSMSTGAMGYPANNRLVYDENKVIPLDSSNDKKVSDDSELYKIKEKNIYWTDNKDVFDKACIDQRNNLIYGTFLKHQKTFASVWFQEVQSKSNAILDDINNKNEVYWQKLRTEIEEWQLEFVSLQSIFYQKIIEFDVKFCKREIFNKEVYEKWDDKNKTDKEFLFHLFNEIKYSLDNISTPGHTHDEQLLQHETEKVNERILLLSFLAMSIPMIGAILTPSLSLNLKLISGSVILILPLTYLLTRKLTVRRNIKSNTKDYLKTERKEFSNRKIQMDATAKSILDSKEMHDDIKKQFKELIDKMRKSIDDKLDKIDKKIKSL